MFFLNSENLHTLDDFSSEIFDSLKLLHINFKRTSIKCLLVLANVIVKAVLGLFFPTADF